MLIENILPVLKFCYSAIDLWLITLIVSGDQLDAVTAIVDGYHAFFSFSKVRDGYSGNFISILIEAHQVEVENIYT